MKTVVFDLDGTLADTSGDLIAAANACFRGLGHGDMLDHEADQLTAFHGGRAMLRLGFLRLSGEFGEADIDAQFPHLLDYYDQNIDVFTVLYPGAIEAVKWLRAEKFALAICTNKPEWLAEKLLTRLGVRGLFDSLIGADTLATRKPDVAPYRASVERAGGDVGRSLLLGDTETDVKTARARGVPGVLVGFGPEGPEVARLQPDHLIENYGELSGVITDLMP